MARKKPEQKVIDAPSKLTSIEELDITVVDIIRKGTEVFPIYDRESLRPLTYHLGEDFTTVLLDAPTSPNQQVDLQPLKSINSCWLELERSIARAAHNRNRSPKITLAELQVSKALIRRLEEKLEKKKLEDMNQKHEACPPYKPQPYP